MSLFGNEYDIGYDEYDLDDIDAPLSTLGTLLRGFMLTHGNLVASLPKRAPMKRMAKETYLDGDVCPPGTAPCFDDECPPEGLNIYTASGEECYDASVVRDARTKRVNELKARSKKQRQIRDPRMMMIAARELSEIVKAAAVLSSRIQGIGHANVSCSGVDALSSDVDKKRAFCGTLTTDKGERRCQFDDAAKTCSPIAGVAQPAVAAVAAAAAPGAPAPVVPAGPSGPSPDLLAQAAARREALKEAALTVAQDKAVAYAEAEDELRAEESKLKDQLNTIDAQNVKSASDNASYALNLMKPSTDLAKAKESTDKDVASKLEAATTVLTQTRTALTSAQSSISAGVNTLKARGENPLAGGENPTSDEELEALRKDALLQIQLFQGFVQSALNELPQNLQNLPAEAVRELGIKANEHAMALKEQFNQVQITNELYIKGAQNAKNQDKNLKKEEKDNLRSIANAAASVSSGELKLYSNMINLQTSLEKSHIVAKITALKQAVQAAGTVDEKSDQLNAVIQLYKDKFLELLTKLEFKLDAITVMYEEQKRAAVDALASGSMSPEDRKYYEVVDKIAPVVMRNVRNKRRKLQAIAEQPLPDAFLKNMEEVVALIKAQESAGQGAQAAGGMSTKMKVILGLGVASTGFVALAYMLGIGFAAAAPAVAAAAAAPGAAAAATAATATAATAAAATAAAAPAAAAVAAAAVPVATAAAGTSAVAAAATAAATAAPAVAAAAAPAVAAAAAAPAVAAAATAAAPAAAVGASAAAVGYITAAGSAIIEAGKVAVEYAGSAQTAISGLAATKALLQYVGAINKGAFGDETTPGYVSAAYSGASGYVSGAYKSVSEYIAANPENGLIKILTGMKSTLVSTYDQLKETEFGKRLLGITNSATSTVSTYMNSFIEALKNGGQSIVDWVKGVDPAFATGMIAIMLSLGALGWAARAFYKKMSKQGNKNANLIVIKGNNIDTDASLNNIVTAFTLSVGKLQTIYDHVSILPSITDKTSLQLQANEEAKSIVYKLNATKYPLPKKASDKLNLSKLNAMELALLSMNPAETLQGYNVDCADFNKVYKGDTETQGRVCETSYRVGTVNGGVPKCAYSIDEDANKDPSIKPNQCYDAADYNPKTTYAADNDQRMGAPKSYSSWGYLSDSLKKWLNNPESIVDPAQRQAILELGARFKLYEDNNVPFRLSREEFDLYSSLVDPSDYTAKEKRFASKYGESK